MEQAKKKRGENWTSEEKEILRQIIAQSSHILEDKSTKTNINNLKTNEWKNVKTKFNKITGKNRTEGEIKLAWKRMKLAAKANLLNRNEESHQAIVNSNIEFKKRQLEMMEEEHGYKIKISKLKIKKLEFEIDLLEVQKKGTGQ